MGLSTARWGSCRCSAAPERTLLRWWNACPSLDLPLELVQVERDKRLGHFDALDGKAGIVLGFSGSLITSASEASTVFRIGGVLGAAFGGR